MTIVVPLGGCLLIPVLGAINERLMKWYTVSAGFATAALTVALIRASAGHEITALYWIPGVDATFGLQLTGIGMYVAAVAGCIGSLAILYSIKYMEDLESEYRPTRYYFLTLLFIGSMIALALADNFLVLYVFWELIGFCSFALIAYEYRKAKAREAGAKAFIVTRFGDIGLLVGVVVLWSVMKDLGAENPFSIKATIQAAVAGQIPAHLLAIAGGGFLAGAIGKSAQFPLHVWLPDAMEAPTTISALIHAATLVNAGVYLCARTLPMFEQISWWLPALAWIGAISALIAALLALVEKDLKRVLAFSTISQLGYMMAAVGAASVFASQFHLLNHATFKALLFLCAGSVIHAAHTRNMYEMGGLKRSMPITHITFLIGTLALAGVPLLNGFWSKDAIFEALAHSGQIGPLVLLIITALLTAIYSWRMYWLTFQDEPRAEGEPHESPWQMTAPLVALGVGTLVSWLYVGGYTTKLGVALPYHRVEIMELGELWHHTIYGVGHGPLNPLLLIGLAVVAILVGLAVQWGRRGAPVPEAPRMWADLVTDTKGFMDWFWGFWYVVMRAVASVLSLFQTGDLNYNSLWLAIGFIAVLLMFLGWG
ncbi:MAG: NADH-quinone oxidoreductase subunit L [Armatimonadota bacterium]